MYKPTRKIIVVVLLGLLAALALGGFMIFRGPEGEYFDSAGVRIHYTDEGSGVPVILVHGFAATSNLNWRLPGIINRLKKDYRVIAMDARAHGFSDKPHDKGKYGMNMADDVARLMDHLEIEKAHLAGYSMGGFISLAFAGKYPDRLLSLTQGGSGWYPRGEYPDLVETVPKSLEAGTGLEPIVRFMEPKDAWFLERRIQVINFFLCLVNDEVAMGRCFGELESLEGTEEQLKTKTFPSLGIMGTKDPLRKSAEFMAERAGNHKLHWIEGADHLTTLNNWWYVSEFTQTLVDFLEENTPKTAETATRQ